MNWFKAKNLVLISLVALNILLIAMILITNNNYILSNEQAENIYQVLSSKYNIAIYTELPKKYEPLREIEVVNEGENVSNFLYNLFFGDEDNVNTLIDGDKIIFQGQDKTLMTQSGDFVVTVNNDIEIKKDSLLREFEKEMGTYVLYESYIYEDANIYDYRQEYMGEIIYTNYLLIEESDDKVNKVEGYFSRPIGYFGEKMEIVSIDLVLFNLANYYPKDPDEQLFIDDIKLVYNQEQIISEPNVVSKATPCYLILVRGSIVPVKIDAYTNTILFR